MENYNFLPIRHYPGNAHSSITPSGIISCISFNRTDRMRLFNFSPTLVNSIRSAIRESWKQGIQSEVDYYGAKEFKLYGNPWLGNVDEAVSSRRLLTAILKCMAKNGWNLIASADISKKSHDKDTLFFEYVATIVEPMMFAMSFNMNDRLRIIEADQQVQTVVQNTIHAAWKKGVQNKREYYGALEFKLAGWPWFADGKETVEIRLLLVQILNELRKIGYKLYASVDISAGTDGKDLESWVFRKIDAAYQ
ncbi:uncharacterized protein VTP21DRAFT_4289 [Calcarisporiella thermophila]|uniref:uncharacterized protein n=1 Tax=Calcarisporiella thermophila TaxID=911321 RepID=UPI003742DC9A